MTAWYLPFFTSKTLHTTFQAFAIGEHKQRVEGGANLPFPEVADQWFAEYIERMRSKGTPLSPTSEADYASAVNVLKRLVISDIRKLDSLAIERLIISNFNSNGRRRKIRSILFMILEQARSARIIHDNPCAKVKFKKEFKKCNQLTPEEAGHFLRQARKDRWPYYPVAFLAFYLGLRSGELRALRKSHIDIKAMRVDVKESVTTRGIRKPPKNGNERECFFGPPVKDFLMTYLPTIKGQDLFPKEQFPALYRGELTKEQVDRASGADQRIPGFGR